MSYYAGRPYLGTREEDAGRSYRDRVFDCARFPWPSLGVRTSSLPHHEVTEESDLLYPIQMRISGFARSPLAGCLLSVLGGLGASAQVTGEFKNVSFNVYATADGENSFFR